jgi:hypothetical protein
VPSIAVDAVAESYFASTVERARCESKALVYVVVDGSSINLTDSRSEKDFGPIGSPNCPARGLKVMNAIAVSREGVPLGLVDQLFWARPPRQKLSRAEAAKRNASRPFADKETVYVDLPDDPGRVRTHRSTRERLCLRHRFRHRAHRVSRAAWGRV